MSKAIQAYLSKYSEPVIHTMAKLPQFSKKYICVIPCYDETCDFIERLTQHPDAHKLAIVLVVNQPKEEPFTQNSRNLALVKHLKNNGNVKWQHKNLNLIIYKNCTFFVAQYTCRIHALPTKYGVGLARKTGADIALFLIHNKYIETAIIFSTDADATLPAKYFDEAKIDNHTSAWVYDYTHTKNNGAISNATDYYEQAIKYYKTGLEWAGSPYAFHTLGSTLAVNALSYCAVRGFPKRPAGEDFYLLNKLAKVGKIQALNSTILLESRLSHRVPFGTGPAAQNIMDNNTNLNNIETLNYTYYAPSCFLVLKDILIYINRLLQQYSNHKELAAALFDTFKPSQYVTVICHVLTALNIQKFLMHCMKQHCSQEQFISHFHIWFDGFLTLKCIRYLSEHTFKPTPLAECLKKAPFIASVSASL